MKRLILFLATNLAVMLVLSVVLSVLFQVFGIDSRSIGGVLMFAVLFGFSGSIISLFLSKSMAKRSTGAMVIAQPRNATEQWLLATVQQQAKQAGIGMPEVAIYDSPEMNAFATGANRNNALVAVSTGLLRNMRQEEVEAVLAHEVSHVANGDMITMALIQGVVNTFVIFIARMIAGAISGGRDGQSSNGAIYMLTVVVLELLFGFLASLIVMWFSRHREYRADAGAARLVGSSKMIMALERLKTNHESRLDDKLLAFGIASKAAKSELLLTHPPLEKRIAALRGI